MTTHNDAEGTTRPAGKRIAPWLAVALLLLGSAAVVMLVDRGAATSPDVSAADGQRDNEDDAGANQESPPADVRPGKVAAGGATVYPLQSGLTVGDYKGIDVVAVHAPVHSVIDGAGFWVGTSKRDRIFVMADELSDVEAGATVNFTGVVQKHGPRFAERIGVDVDEGARRLRKLQGHIKADEITVS